MNVSIEFSKRVNWILTMTAYNTSWANYEQLKRYNRNNKKD